MATPSVIPRVIRGSSKQILHVTECAAKRIAFLVSNHVAISPSCKDRSLKVGLQRKGCSGLSYSLSFVNPETCHPDDEIIKCQNLSVVVDYRAVMFLVGTEMDYVEGPISAEFKFKNPNEKMACGCGKSFTV